MNSLKQFGLSQAKPPPHSAGVVWVASGYLVGQGGMEAACCGGETVNKVNKTNMTASVSNEEFAPGESKSESQPELVFQSSATYFEERKMPEHMAALCQLSQEEGEHIEAAIRGNYPNLPATAVDNAAHAVMRRLWHLAPKVASGCETAAEFKKQLYKVLRRCVTFSALDEERKYQRQRKILESQFFSYWEIEHSGFANEAVQPEEVDDLLKALREELLRMKSPRTLAVLEVIRDYNWECGGLHPVDYETPSTEQISLALKKRRIPATDDDIRLARVRIKAVAVRVMEERNWCLHELPKGSRPGG